MGDGLTEISNLIQDLLEINNTKEISKKKKLLSIFEEYPIELINIDNIDEVTQLGLKYVQAGIIPKKKIIDAYHIAVCTIYEMNYLVSWNFRHLANINKERQVKIVNLQNKYLKELRIITPLELFDYEN